MKKIYILAALAIGFVATSQAQIDYEENFDLMIPGDVSPQHPNWRTWSGTSGGGEDAQVVTDVVNSAPNALQINEIGAPAGIDQIMYVQAAPTSGVYSLQWEMYIPAGREGYFNMQGEATPDGTAWVQHLNGGNVYFNEANGSPGQGTVDGTPGQSFAFPHDQWFTLTLVYNIDAETWAMYVDGLLQFDDQEFVFNDPFVELGAIDFYALGADTFYHVDDVVQYNGDITTASVNDIAGDNFAVYPNPVQDILNISSTEVVDTVQVYDVLGKLVMEVAPNAVSPTVDMSALTSGAYFVRVAINGTANTVKVIK